MSGIVNGVKADCYVSCQFQHYKIHLCSRTVGELVWIVLGFSLVPKKLVKEQSPEMVGVCRDLQYAWGVFPWGAFCPYSVDTVGLMDQMCHLHKWEAPFQTGYGNLVETYSKLFQYQYWSVSGKPSAYVRLMVLTAFNPLNFCWLLCDPAECWKRVMAHWCPWQW